VDEALPGTELATKTLDKLVIGKDMRAALGRGLTTMHNDIFGEAGPTDQPGYVGSMIYHRGTYHLGRELGQFGFAKKTAQNQVQLVNPDFDGFLISLVVGTGWCANKIVHFSWPKRPVTRKAVRENRATFGDATRPFPGFEEVLGLAVPITPRINIGIACTVRWDYLLAWLFVGTKFVTSKMLSCAATHLVCNERFEQNPIADIAVVDDTSSYSFDEFRPRATGT
jgi:hypothetical protein